VGVITENYRDLLDRNKADIIPTIKTKKFEFVDDAETKVNVVSIKPVYSVLGPEFKDKSNKIITALQTLPPKRIFEEISKTGHYNLELKDGEAIKLTSKHISIETKIQVHGRDVEIIDINNITILIEK